MTPSAHSTPKRKRGDSESAHYTHLRFSFDSSLANESDDGSNSPRSSVAHRFRGLELHERDVGSGSGGGVRLTPDYLTQDHEPQQLAKRVRHDENMHEAAESSGDVPNVSAIKPANTIGIIYHDDNAPQPATVGDEQLGHDLAQNAGQNSELIPDIPDSKHPVRKRAGTPPLRVKRLLSKLGDGNKDVVDPVRAALTWHEDEITIYDPDDEDDDGTGINGVGFKPTAAIAHARVVKRRQQMAEYRRREESDARSRRSQRRRGGLPSQRASAGPSSSPPRSQDGGVTTEDTDRSPRKVRFTDVDATPVAISTK